MDCSECQTLFASYVLDDLSPGEREAVHAHMESGCPLCGAELAAAEAVIAQLPLALNPVAPPSRVKEQLMRRVHGDRQSPRITTGPSASSARSWRWGEPLVAAAAAAAIATTVFWVKLDQQRSEIDSLRDELSRQRARFEQLQAGLERDSATIRLFASPAVQLVSLQGSDAQPGSKARVFWDRSGNTFHFYASGLKPLPASRAYELWFINSDQKKIPAGTFTASRRGEASLVTSAPREGGEIAAMAVTEEPEGGSPQPTGQIQLIGKPG